MTRPSIQSARAAGANQGAGQVAGDQPEQERQQHHDRGHLLDERQAEQDADGDPPSPRALARCSPFQNARAVAAQSKRPGVSVSIRCAWP